MREKGRKKRKDQSVQASGLTVGEDSGPVTQLCELQKLASSTTEQVYIKTFTRSYGMISPDPDHACFLGIDLIVFTWGKLRFRVVRPPTQVQDCLDGGGSKEDNPLLTGHHPPPPRFPGSRRARCNR